MVGLKLWCRLKPAPQCEGTRSVPATLRGILAGDEPELALVPLAPDGDAGSSGRRARADARPRRARCAAEAPGAAAAAGRANERGAAKGDDAADVGATDDLG